MTGGKTAEKLVEIKIAVFECKKTILTIKKRDNKDENGFDKENVYSMNSKDGDSKTIKLD